MKVTLIVQIEPIELDKDCGHVVIADDTMPDIQDRIIDFAKRMILEANQRIFERDRKRRDEVGLCL